MAVQEIPLRVPDEDVVAALEEMLSMAKSGELSGLVVAGTLAEGRTFNRWAGMNKMNMALLGELVVVQRDFMDLMIDLRVDPRTGEDRF